METIFRWLAGLLAGILERYADPELQSKLDGFNKRVAEAEAKEKEAAKLAQQSELAYQESLRNREAWDKLLAESRENEKLLEGQLRASQERATKIRDEADKAKENLDRLSGGDRVRVDL